MKVLNWGGRSSQTASIRRVPARKPAHARTDRRGCRHSHELSYETEIMDFNRVRCRVRPGGSTQPGTRETYGKRKDFSTDVSAGRTASGTVFEVFYRAGLAGPPDDGRGAERPRVERHLLARMPQQLAQPYGRSASDRRRRTGLLSGKRAGRPGSCCQATWWRSLPMWCTGTGRLPTAGSPIWPSSATPATNVNTWLEPVDDAQYDAATASRPVFSEGIPVDGAKDPGIIRNFDNFVLGEVLGHGGLDARTRLMCILASNVASQGRAAFRATLDGVSGRALRPLR